MRALAIVAVLAAHLVDWPRGGSIGIDVFFVISGFFVTDMLLRSAEPIGSVPLRRFWLDRARRILPSAILVLIATVIASLALLPGTAHQIAADALFSLVFLANWHFVAQGADASPAVDADSPLLHYWPLAIEEQFYLVWPLLLLAITAVVARRAWSRERWLGTTAATTGVITAASLAWATYETTAAPHWAFFNTFARVWELGAGALLATAVGGLSTLSVWLRPVLSWAGVTLIVSAMFLIDPEAGGFPVPWALLPVVGTLLVIAGGIGSEPLFQPLLSNRAATYLGDLSYALYLVHWPVIVLLATTMHTDVYFYVAALALSSGLAIALHHFVEEPPREFSWGAVRQARQDIKHGLFHVQRATKVAAVAALVLITLAVIAFAARPDRFEPDQHALPCCDHVG
ncbi:acyltransferase family protein [Mycolicibacterium sp. 018/SC-01/001]|uniref:acyltransferase family protein n=1 Tax=Mycolicibacterium sp. 018/SC-01/001 TaxID=2592069 RepID=UPI00351A45BA